MLNYWNQPWHVLFDDSWGDHLHYLDVPIYSCAGDPDPGDAVGSCAVTYGQGCHGLDIKHVPARNAYDCCESCKNLAECGAFTFVDGGSYANTCYLKSACFANDDCAGHGVCTSGVLTWHQRSSTSPPLAISPDDIDAPISVVATEAII